MKPTGRFKVCFYSIFVSNYSCTVHQPIVKNGYKRNQNVILKTSLSDSIRHDKLEKCDVSPLVAFIKIEKQFDSVRNVNSDQQAITEGVSSFNSYLLYKSSLYKYN